MLIETALESLQYFNRSELEGLQIHSRFLRDFVDSNANKLPLRFIYEISTVCVGRSVDIRLERGKRFNEDDVYKVPELTEASLRLLLARVNGAFVERLVISFVNGSVGARFLGYLNAHAAALECRVGTVVDFTNRSPAHVDYALVDFVATHLKPRALEVPALDDRLHERASMRSTLEHVETIDRYYSVPAECVIPGLLNVDSLKTCAFRVHADATPWVVRFANTFETSTLGAKVISSIVVVCARGFYDAVASTSVALPLLGLPQRVGIPAPQSDFVKDFLPHPTTQTDIVESAAELYVFMNAEAGKRLDVYKWTVDETNPMRRIDEPYVMRREEIFLLQTVDV